MEVEKLGRIGPKFPDFKNKKVIWVFFTFNVFESPILNFKICISFEWAREFVAAYIWKSKGADFPKFFAVIIDEVVGYSRLSGINHEWAQWSETP